MSKAEASDTPSDGGGELPSAVRIVIVGGGVVGCSLAYHLGKLGWKDVLLLEQGKVAGGTSWHAAGLVGQLRTSNSLTRINKYSVELYQTLQAETGCETGWNEVGSLVVGTSEERMSQLRRTAAMAEVFGVEAHLIGPDEAGEKWPLMRTDDV
ncbi:MAG: FAD-binding oxidoreductase, partial [Akkermansiaceae bacterium]|nr:FAD-binding oxidoreductase [Akkermansiaceae bacterium]